MIKLTVLKSAALFMRHALLYWLLVPFVKHIIDL